MKLKIFGDTVPVLKAKNLESAGEYHINEKKIFIKDDLVGDQYYETVLHELMEAVFFRCSIYQSIDHGSKEIFIDCIAKAIVENFKLKPK